MCETCEKYKISEKSYKEMVKNGVISTTFAGYDEIYSSYKECLKKGMSSAESVNVISAQRNISKVTVYKAIKLF